MLFAATSEPLGCACPTAARSALAGGLRVAALLTGIGVVLAARPASADELCRLDTTPTEVRVTTTFDPVTELRNQSIRRLTARKANGDGVHRGHTQHVLGLARTPVAYRSEMQVSYRTGLAAVCGRLTSVTVELKLREPVIWIAAELPAGSCASRSVRDHEWGHIRIAQDAVRAGQGQMETHLRRAVDRLGPVRAPSLEAFNTRVQSYVSDVLKGAHARIMRQLSARHGAYDSDREYARRTQACGDDIPRLVRRSLRR